MRRGLSRSGRAALLGCAGFCLLGPLARPAPAQVPQPEVNDLEQRSGLISRYQDIPYKLPYDKRRDTFYGNTRFVDNPNPHCANNIKNGGLYGFRWRGNDTASVYPYFYGSPGASTIGPHSRPWPKPLRYLQGMVHPFRPVGMYYTDGSYVPLYDLDPIVPGPGPYPFPWYFGGPRGG